MAFIQSVLHKLLVAILSIAGVADGSGRVPRLVAYVRSSQDPAAGVSGTWTGTTGQGRPLLLQLKTGDGSALTGRLTLDEQSGAVKDGRIERGTVRFAAVIAGRALELRGEASGDAMTLRLDGAQSPVTLKRVK